jgi:hypothetical protein
MFILLSCICRVLGTQDEPWMSAVCAFVAFRMSFKKKKKKQISTESGIRINFRMSSLNLFQNKGIFAKKN